MAVVSSEKGSSSHCPARYSVHYPLTPVAQRFPGPGSYPPESIPSGVSIHLIKIFLSHIINALDLAKAGFWGKDCERSSPAEDFEPKNVQQGIRKGVSQIEETEHRQEVTDVSKGCASNVHHLAKLTVAGKVLASGHFLCAKGSDSFGPYQQSYLPTRRTPTRKTRTRGRKEHDGTDGQLQDYCRPKATTKMTMKI